MKRKPLQVRLDAREPSIIEITVGDRVQFDRVVASPTGQVAERHGDLLQPGTTRLALAQGHYFFRTLSDAKLRVVCGGVDTSVRTNDKDPWPDPPPRLFGDDSDGETPTLTLE